MSKSQMICVALVLVIAYGSCQPLDLGRGGVYNSPEANAYWAQRFGRGFFSNLASIQKGINSVAKLNKAKLGKETPIPEVINIKQNVEEVIENDLKEQDMMQEAPEVLTVHPGPIYFDDVHF